MDTAFFEAAILWVARGIGVIPVVFRGKRPACAWQQYQDRLPTIVELGQWNAKPHNLGVVCGWKGLTVLDFDSLDGWRLWREWAQGDIIANYVATHTYQVMTARGVHVYVFTDRTTRSRPMGFMDIKGKGGMVLAPPSIHPSGAVYQALRDDAEIARVPSVEDILPPAWIREPEPMPSPTEPATLDPWDVANRAEAPMGISVEEIKKRVRIETFFSNLTPTGRGYFLALCPLHDDHNPSMWVDTGRQLCGCYVGCTKKPLDVINLWARMKGISNDEALRELAGQQHN